MLCRGSWNLNCSSRKHCLKSVHLTDWVANSWTHSPELPGPRFLSYLHDDDWKILLEVIRIPKYFKFWSKNKGAIKKLELKTCFINRKLTKTSGPWFLFFNFFYPSLAWLTDLNSQEKCLNIKTHSTWKVNLENQINEIKSIEVIRNLLS